MPEASLPTVTKRSACRSCCIARTRAAVSSTKRALASDSLLLIAFISRPNSAISSCWRRSRRRPKSPAPMRRACSTNARTGRPTMLLPKAKGSADQAQAQRSDGGTQHGRADIGIARLQRLGDLQHSGGFIAQVHRRVAVQLRVWPLQLVVQRTVAVAHALERCLIDARVGRGAVVGHEAHVHRPLASVELFEQTERVGPAVDAPDASHG